MKIYVLTYNGTVVRAFVVGGEGALALHTARAKAEQDGSSTPGLWELQECTLYGHGQAPA